MKNALVSTVLRLLSRRSRPDYQGTVNLAGLDADVQVRFDEYAIPRIHARSEGDAWRTLGFLHACERLFQMDFNRRAISGRLAEILGDEPLGWEDLSVVFRNKRVPDLDRFMRVLGLRRAAEIAQLAISDKGMATLNRYAEGVNAFIAKGPLPLEFKLLKYKPEPWAPVDTVSMVKGMAYQLCYSWRSLLAQWQLSHVLADQPQLARELLPPEYPAEDPRILSYVGPGEAEALIAADVALRLFNGWVGPHGGSNNWVVNGSLSKTGKPILCSDPHLFLTSPGVWYAAGIESPDLSVMGVTLPGAPGVTIGRNRSIAWGMTNVMAHDADLFVERVSPDDPHKVLVGDQYESMTVLKETIGVKGKADVPIEVRVTRHGPVLTDAVGGGNGHVLAFKWTGHEPSNEVEALIDLNHAQDFDAFSAALEKFGSPAQNVIYADIKGNIGYVLAGRIPIRRNGRGTTPVPGWLAPGEDDFEWTGFVPYEAQPKVLNPDSGFIATANNKSVSDSYPFYISSYWEPPYRIRRIRQRLSEIQRHTLETMKSIQQDVHSIEAEEFVRDLVAPWADRLERLDLRGPGAEQIRRAVETLLEWDFRCTPDSRAAAIYHSLFAQVLRDVFEPRLGEDLWLLLFENWNEALMASERVLRDPNSGWMEGKRIEDVLMRAMTRALDNLKRELGADPRHWTWGRLHTLTMPHPLGGHPLLGPSLNLGPYPSRGTSFTVNNGQFFYAHPFKHVAGPGLRQVVDLADPERSAFIVNAGQSGNLASPHREDLAALWLRGEYVPMTLDLPGTSVLTLRAADGPRGA
ncbi:MAG: penicillin acylase family protein [Deltaproteobacteria bacterium]|nr:penicillin acylase family protein [Deltaproteobacteria bacterium]